MGEGDVEWLVELEGHPFELSELQEELRFEFKHLLSSLVKKDNRYWLKSSRFEELADAKAVHNEAKKFITTIKALAKSKSEDIDYTSIEIGASVAGKSVLAVFAKPTPPEFIKFYKKCGMYQSFKSHETVTEIGPSLHKQLREQGALVLERDDDICERVISLYKDSKQKAPQQGVVFALKYIFTDTSKQDTSLHKEYLYDNYKHLFNSWIDDVYKSVAFSYFAEEPSWHSLYNVYEMLKYDIDGTLSNKKDSLMYQWVDESKINDFTNAANSVFSEGSPRHSLACYLNLKNNKFKEKSQAFRNYIEQKREPEPLISLAYASVLIKCLFKKWYQLKLLKFRLSYFISIANYLTKEYNLRCVGSSTDSSLD